MDTYKWLVHLNAVGSVWIKTLYFSSATKLNRPNYSPVCPTIWVMQSQFKMLHMAKSLKPPEYCIIVNVLEW